MNILFPDLLTLQTRIQTPVGQILHSQAMESADAALSHALPDEPIAIADCAQRSDGKYTATYLNNLQLFDRRSWFFHNAFIALSYAYMISQDRRYLNAFCTHAQRCLIDSRFGPPNAEYDHCSSRLCRALAVSCSWIGADLPPQTRHAIDSRLMEEIQGFLKKYERAGDLYPIGPNDHQCKDLAGAGIACIYLMPDHPELQDALNRFVSLYADKFVPETATDEGGWIDGYELLFYALMDTAPFMEAVRFAIGRDISGNPKLRFICQHVVPGQLSINASFGSGTPEKACFRYTHGLFYLASTYRDAELQHFAKQLALEGLSDPVFAPYSLVYYDPSLASAPSTETVHIAKDFGLMRLGTGFGADHVYVWLRSGPAEAFCRNNQNGLLLTAYGIPLLSNVTMPNASYQRLWDAVYNEGLFTTRCANALLIDGQNQQRNLYGEDWRPIAHFHQPNRPKWNDPDAWWFDFDAPKEPLGTALCAFERGCLRVMSGSADHAYGSLLHRYTRHVVQIEEDLVVILDALCTDKPRHISFRTCTDHSMLIESNNVVISAQGAFARLAFSHDAALSTGTWPFQPERGCYMTAEWHLPAGDHVLVSAIRTGRQPDTLSLQVNCAVRGSVCKISADGFMLSVPFPCYQEGTDIRLE